MKRFVVSLALVLGSALIVLGCASSAAAKPVETNQVELPPSYRFAPADIQVVAGTTVTWHNGDNFTHSVRLAGADAKVIRPGESTTIRFDKPGTYRYDCSFHPNDMKGTVLVVAK